MGFRNGAYATVWSVEEKSSTKTKVNLSVSRKNKNTGEYETEFSGFVDFVGTANAAKALKLSRKDRIKLGDVDVVTWKPEGGDKYHTTFKAFGFEELESSGGGESKRDDDYESGPDDDGEPRLPF